MLQRNCHLFPPVAAIKTYPEPVAAITSREDHPATQAWLRVRPQSSMPHRIDQFTRRRKLKKGRKSSVFRLYGVGDDGANVIAKTGNRETFELELMIYQEILARLPISSVKIIGWVDDAGAAPWLFMEDAGDERLISDNSEHHVAAARWLAGLHSNAASVSAIARLPARDAYFYRGRLQNARALALTLRADPRLTRAGRATLDEMDSVAEELDTRWEAFDAFCALMPSTLVHGDFAPKNVKVMRDIDGDLSVVVVDWETAGLACPATDLELIHPLEHGDGISAYLDVARAKWKDLAENDIRRMAHVGVIFRNVQALNWSCMTLNSGKLERPLRQIPFYTARLRELANTFDR